MQSLTITIDEILDVDFQYQYVNRQFISNNSCLF